MRKTMMYLPDDMHRFLVREAEERGLSMAQIVREAIGEYRVKLADARPARVSAIFGVLDDAGPETDLVTSIDESLRQHFAEGGDWEREHGLADTD